MLCNFPRGDLCNLQLTLLPDTEAFYFDKEVFTIGPTQDNEVIVRRFNFKPGNPVSSVGK